MQIEKFTQTYLDSILDKEKQPVVSASLETLRLGKLPTPRTPLFKDIESDKVFKMWTDILNQEASKYPDLVEYDLSRLEKTGPQGGYPPFTDRFETFENYFKPGKITLDTAKREYLINKTRNYLFGSATNKRPMTYESVVKRDVDEDKLNTNSGCPSYGKRSDSLIQQRAVRDANSGKWREFPAILGSRSQRGKDRFIFMFPFSTNLVEKSFLLPLMDIIRSRNISSFSAWEGFDKVEIAMGEQNFFKTKTKISMDYTKMDQHCGIEFTQFVYDIIAPIFQEKYRALLKESLFHTNVIKVIIGMDKLASGEHGLASGSGWTNFNESVFSQAVHFEIQDAIGTNLVGDQLLGDDGTFSYNEDPDKDIVEIIADVSAKFGQVANPDKQRRSATNCIYLQRFFDQNIYIEGTNVVAGSYPSILALNTAMNPERFHDPRKWNEEMEILRWIMILENCNHSPYFKQLIEFFIEGDKFKLGLTIPGFFKRGIVKAYEEAKSINGFVPSYNQTNFDRGILDFDVVRYLRAKSR